MSSDDCNSIAERLVRRRVRQKLDSSVTRSLEQSKHSQASQIEDINVWRVIMQFLSNKKKLHFMRTGKLGVRIVANPVCWKYHPIYVRPTLNRHNIPMFYNYISTICMNSTIPFSQFCWINSKLNSRHLEVYNCDYASIDQVKANTRAMNSCVKMTKFTAFATQHHLDFLLPCLPKSCKTFTIVPPCDSIMSNMHADTLSFALSQFETIEMCAAYRLEASHYSELKICELEYRDAMYSDNFLLSIGEYFTFLSTLKLVYCFPFREAPAAIVVMDHFFRNLVDAAPHLVELQLNNCFKTSWLQLVRCGSRKRRSGGAD